MKNIASKIMWIFRMSWRENRRQKRRLLLFISAIIIGIAALVAINSFRINLDTSVDRKAKSLLGADLVLTGNRPFNQGVWSLVDSLGFEYSHEISATSMIYFPGNGKTRLVRLRAIEGNFPYYGAAITIPEQAYLKYQDGKNALIDEAMMIQFNISPGDSAVLGSTQFQVIGALQSISGQTAAASTVAPAVIIPQRFLKETNLLGFGSIAIYRIYLKTPKNFDVEIYVAENSKFFSENGIRIDTTERSKQQISQISKNLTAFLNLIGLFSLILGGIGISSSITVYIRQKMTSVAVLRCLGCTSRMVFGIYLFQTLFFGLIGTISGVLLGLVLQFVIPEITRSFLPVDVDVFLAWSAITEGLSGGFVITVLFTLLPLVSIRHISPMLTLRSSFEAEKVKKIDTWTLIILSAIILLFLAFLNLQFNDFQTAIIFISSIIAAIGLFGSAAKLLMVSIRKFLPRNWSYVWRQGLANLYRPNNQTPILLMALGMGTYLIVIMYLTQFGLLKQVAFSGSDNRPNMVLFDIQTDQREAVRQELETRDYPVIQDVSIVTMRLQSINDRSIYELRQDTTVNYEFWALNAELRVTYRSQPTSAETIVAGEYRGTVEDTIFVSVADRYREAINLSLGDKLTFDVQGIPMETYVGSVREINWQDIQPNFLMVFPEGVLEEAPQFSVFVTRLPDAEASAEFQRAMVNKFPGVSIIDLKVIIETLENVLDQIAFVIQFMSFFTIATGIIILIGSLNISRIQRMNEALLLRTIGARQYLIKKIMVIEYLLLGGLSAGLGIILAIFSTWALFYFVFNVPFTIPLTGLIITFILLISLTIAIGSLGSRRIFNQPPLEVLRIETQ